MGSSTLFSAALIGALFALPASAQEEPPAAANASREEPIEEVVVRGRRTLFTIRKELEAARENVWTVFNDINSTDDFDISCSTAARTGTRITKRVCRPQYANEATRRAGQDLARRIRNCGSEPGAAGDACLERAMQNASSGAAAEIGWTTVMDQRLDAEFQGLAVEQPGLATAILEYFAKQREYQDAIGARAAAEGGNDEVRRRPSIQASASIIETDVGFPSRSAPRRNAVMSPRPVDLAIPDARPNREGWVKLRYSVRADGSTGGVRAVDVVPPGLDPSSAVAAAQAWTFEPAAENGVPIDWHNNVAVVAFRRSDAMHEGSLELADAYADVAELIAGGRLEDAKARNAEMQRVYAETLQELQLAQLQLAAIEHALGRPHAALAAIRRATEQGVAGLAEEERKLALEHRFALELELGYTADALRTYERRDELERVPPRELLAQQAAALQQALAAPDATHAVQGRIAVTGDWEHALPSSAFELGGVQGGVESLAVECHRKKAELPFQPSSEITIPATWGGCMITIRGQPETTFTLYEFH